MKFIDEKILDYSIEKSNAPSETCDQLEDFTRQNVDMSQMLVGKLEASLLGFLIKSHGMKSVLEIGTFTGYSALSMAEVLPEDGKIISLDIDAVNAKIAKDFWNKSPHGSKITQIIGPALNSLETMEDKFDLVFIDADKENYLAYLKACLGKLEKNGMIILDNVLWSGRVLDLNDNTSSTVGIREVNDFVENSKDLYGTLLPIRDGIFLVQKV